MKGAIPHNTVPHIRHGLNVLHKVNCKTSPKSEHLCRIIICFIAHRNLSAHIIKMHARTCISPVYLSDKRRPSLHRVIT